MTLATSCLLGNYCRTFILVRPSRLFLTFLARLELERLAGNDIDREGSTLRTLSLVENSGWLLHWGRSWTPSAQYKLTGVDPAISGALNSIGAPICRNYRRLGSVSLRRSREIWESFRASRSPSAASSSA